jgi:dihydrofolate reductase
MMVSLIVAMDKNQGIGQNNRLPWRLSADLQRFKKLTMGHYLIVGRKTYETIGKALPGRKMIVVTRNSNFKATGCLTVHSIEEALNVASRSGEKEVFIGGGAELFADGLKFADRLYLTEVHAITKSNIFFPSYNPNDWEVSTVSYVNQDEKNQYQSTFKILQKKTSKEALDKSLVLHIIGKIK